MSPHSKPGSPLGRMPAGTLGPGAESVCSLQAGLDSTLIVLSRALSPQDLTFIEAQGIPSGPFRRHRRALFLGALRILNRRFAAIQSERRTQMQAAGHVDLPALIRDDLAFKRAYLQARFAAALHPLGSSLAWQLVRSASARIQLCFAVTPISAATDPASTTA